MKIWIIDDDAATRLLIRALIQESDAQPSEILEMASADDAMKSIACGLSADVYLVDLNMPGMDGLKFCRTLRQIGTSNSEFLPYIIVITFSQTEDTPAEVLLAGANDYISKPVSRKLLHTRLRVAGQLIDQARDLAECKYAQEIITMGLAYTSVPMAIVDVEQEGVFTYIVWANIAMHNLIQSGVDATLGQSLAHFQSWQPEMLRSCAACFAVGRPFISRLMSDSTYFSSLDMRVAAYPICPPGENVTQYLILEEPMST